MASNSSAKPSLAQTQRDERRRVAGIIAPDHVHAAREHARHRATLEVRSGVYVNLDDSVSEPTPEWLAKGDVVPFTPSLPDGTVRSVKTVRRVVTPIIVRMLKAGKITPAQFAACRWYRGRHEKSGMRGRWASSSHRLARGGTAGTGGLSPMAMHEGEARKR